MKLYAFSTGTLTFRQNPFTPGASKVPGKQVPIQSFLIVHSKGTVLVDTGIRAEIGLDPKKYWGGAAAYIYGPDIKKQEAIIHQLKDLGYGKETIDYVVLSHMHMDHIGALREFKESTILVQKKEMQAVQQRCRQNEGYYHRDWDYPLSYLELTGRMDVFGDGMVVIEPMPGHTEGMQVVIVNLNKSGKIVIASDAAAYQENLRNGVVSKRTVNKGKYMQSIQRLKVMEDAGALVICGHDPDQWKTIRKAPQYYD